MGKHVEQQLPLQHMCLALHSEKKNGGLSYSHIGRHSHNLDRISIEPTKVNQEGGGGIEWFESSHLPIAYLCKKGRSEQESVHGSQPVLPE